MKNLLKKPKSPVLQTLSRYEKYNLKENPFPTNPSVNKENTDSRYNGEIFESRIRDEEFEKVKKYFLNVPQSDPNHQRIGYILDTSYIGRGNGKSSFCLNLLKKINKEYSLDLSNDVNKCFGIYISPEPSGRTRTFYSVLDLFFESVLNSNIINYCLATLRLQAILELYPDKEQIFEEIEDEAIVVKLLNDAEWYNNNSIEINKVTNKILKGDALVSIPREFPLYKDLNNYNANFIITQQNFKDYYKSLKVGRERLEFIFTHLVNFFIGCGFNGAYVIIDDFERIPDFQSDRQKREFALELRSNFFDGISTNAKVGFYNLILVLHAGVQRLLEKAWSDTGMEQRSPISTINNNANHVIYFNKLEGKDALLLVQKYLSEYRLTETNSEDYTPFTKEAILRIAELAELNAAGILRRASHLLDKASEVDRDVIDELFVNEINEVVTSADSSLIQNIKDEETTNLWDKAQQE
ncbi:hypothetical protein [uncultured Pontibacter sp.]|uniref:hypothetical protein n=1 Tax=uncultured Pontibacter sp. TaxID=453356 RepID=UPI00262F95F2|nr:hypothetical protein [uncultured Pontibacter sp.]